jgi:GAF domain-containing protein
VVTVVRLNTHWKSCNASRIRLFISAQIDIRNFMALPSGLETKRGSGLRATVERLATAASPAEINETLRQSARGLVGSDGIALILRDGDFCHYVEEDAVGPLWKGKKFPMAACISGWSMLKRQTVVIPDIRTDKRIPHDLYAGTFVKGLVMTPVCTDPPVAALGAYWAREYAPSSEEVATVEALARAVGAGLTALRHKGLSLGA